jgi:hypothetical protein
MDEARKHSKSKSSEPFITSMFLACLPFGGDAFLGTEAHHRMFFGAQRLLIKAGARPGEPNKASWLRNSDELV